ncbi:Dabb family protein [Paenibacillus cymbidii]|uniref:Dabb family protein n=1 Tax=Paenibacillus cymbidii TaxID=1639034 RepID=UPI0010803A23|nr:Dabb family protein [Paenibacillus cymbidii]
MEQQTVRHMVIFCLKHEIGSPEAEAFLRAGREELTAIPVVTRFESFRQVSVKNDYDYGFSMEFASQSDYDAYNAHPKHVAFVRDRWEREVTRFLEIDFRL